MSSQTFQSLDLFIKKAEKLGKYRSGTAAGFRSAIDALEAGWSREEPETADYLEAQAEEILARQVETRELSTNTFQTYVQRVRRVIADWRRYNDHPKAFLDWKPKQVSRRSHYTMAFRGPLRTLTWSLRPELTIQVQLPTDFNTDDYRRLQKLLELELELQKSSTP